MKGYGIFVGVNEVNIDHYCSQKKLRSAKKNANAMFKLAQKTGSYQINRKENLMVGPNASWEKTKELLHKYIQISHQEEGYLLAYFSGHGFSPYLKNTTNKEKWEFLCFYDRMVPENEVREILTQFSEKFKILVIIDSCYSGGIGGEKPQDVVLKDVISCKVGHYYSFADVFERHEYFYTKKIKEYPDHDRWDDYHADVCYLGACTPEQTALIGRNGNLSNYTQYFNLLWKQRPFFKGNYIDLHKKLKEGLQTTHEPTIRLNPEGHSYFHKHVPIAFERNYKKDFKFKKWNITPKEEIGKEVVLQLKAPSNQFRLINYKIRDKEKIDLIVVKNYVLDLKKKVDKVVIIQVGIDENSTPNRPYNQVLKDVKPSGRRNGKKIVYLIYDFDHNKVLKHKYSKFKF